MEDVVAGHMELWREILRVGQGDLPVSERYPRPHPAGFDKYGLCPYLDSPKAGRSVYCREFLQLPSPHLGAGREEFVLVCRISRGSRYDTPFRCGRSAGIPRRD